MEIKNEMIDKLIVFFEYFHLKETVKYFKKQSKNSSYQKSIKEIEDFLIRRYEPYFKFIDGSILRKMFIISAFKDWTSKNEPCIIINKLNDDSGFFKDNPIKNFYIVYKNIEERDCDFKRLIENLTI